MSIALLPFVAVAATSSQDGDCAISIGFLNESTPIDITGLTFSITFFAVNALGNTTYAIIEASNAANVASSNPYALQNQYLSTYPAAGVLSLMIPQSRMRSVGAGSYVADIIASDGTLSVVVGQILLTHKTLGSNLITSVVTTARNAATANSVGYVPGPPGSPGATGATGSFDYTSFAALALSLPTTDPGVSGALWNNLGVLTLSGFGSSS